MKAQKAEMKGNEAPQTKNKENQRPQAQKLENRLGHGADKFFVWDLGETDLFGNLWGGAHGRRPEVVKDTPLKAQKPAKSKRIHARKAQKGAKSERIPPLRAQNAKMDAPKAKMEAEKVK